MLPRLEDYVTLDKEFIFHIEYQGQFRSWVAVLEVPNFVLSTHLAAIYLCYREIVAVSPY